MRICYTGQVMKKLYHFISSTKNKCIIFIGCISIFCLSYISGEGYDFDSACASIGFPNQGSHIIITGGKQRKSRCVKLLKDSNNGNCFVVKQAKKNCQKWQFDILGEALGSHIAKSINIPAQTVIIVPVNCLNNVTMYPNTPASIHTFVPGITIGKSSYNKINLRQYTKESIPKDDWGLTYKIIRDMSLHPELPSIVALDTFIGMNDRNSKNYFYDEEADTFWLIDMADSFRKNLSEIACLQVKKMIGNKKRVLTPNECSALESYRNTLQLLIELYPPERLHFWFDTYLRQADFEFSEIDYEERKQIMTESYFSTMELITWLDRIITKNSVL